MLSYFADMSSGKLKCPNVSAEIVTNSIETTDLAIVNLFGRRAMKAFINTTTSQLKMGQKFAILNTKLNLEPKGRQKDPFTE